MQDSLQVDTEALAQLKMRQVITVQQIEARRKRCLTPAHKATMYPPSMGLVVAMAASLVHEIVNAAAERASYRLSASDVRKYAPPSTTVVLVT